MFFNLLFFVKIGFLLLDLAYTIFLFIVFNQVVSMENIISELHSSKLLKTIAIVNIGLAFSLFLITLAIL